MKFKANEQHKNVKLDKAMAKIEKEQDTLIALKIPKKLQMELKSKVATEDTTIRKVLTELITRYINNNITI